MAAKIDGNILSAPTELAYNNTLYTSQAFTLPPSLAPVFTFDKFPGILRQLLRSLGEVDL